MKFFKYSLFICLLVVFLFLSFNFVFAIGCANDCGFGQVLDESDCSCSSIDELPPEASCTNKCNSGYYLNDNCECKKKTSGGGTTQTADSAEVDLDFDYSMNLGSGVVSQLCWTQEDCKNSGGVIYGPNPETIQTCGTGADLKKSIIGFCRPGMKAKTTINFAGRKEFDGMGDFINFMYRYGVIIAGVLAIVMIIVAGFQRVVSAGSPDKIKASTKRIGDALMGLFLAVLAYFILNTLNPYLVNMRLPQVWMINHQELVPVRCDSLPSNSLLAKAYTEADLITTSTVDKVEQKKELSAQDVNIRYKAAVEAGKDDEEVGFSKSSSEAECGVHYFVEGGGTLTCTGSVCPEQGRACVGDTSTSHYECIPAVLTGKIGASTDLLDMCKDLEVNIIDNNLMLIAMFKNGDIDEIDTLDIVDGGRQYIFPPSLKKDIVEAQKSSKGLVGFYLGAEINDEGSGLCPVGGGSGCDDWHAIGKSADHVCNINLGKKAFASLHNGSSPSCVGESGVKNCSCATLSEEKDIKVLAQDTAFKKYLISAEELLASYTCDISITRGQFSALDNGNGLVVCSPDDDTDCWEHQDYF